MAFNYNATNKYYSYTPKDNPKDRIEVEIGDALDASTFHPQVKIKRWDNEVNASIRLVHDSIPGNVSWSDDGEKITWIKKQGQNEWKAVFYHLSDLDEGGFEFEVHLPTKPPVNYLEFTVNTKDLDWFYQPALTQAEIDEGAVRPENVVGSYAVYHKTKGGMNDAAGMEYKVGKAFHVYRPHVVDALGNETYGTLTLDEVNGILKIEVDQTWMNNATYPVVVDPTFGYTGIGATNVSFPLSNTKSTSQFTLSENGTVSKLTIYHRKSDQFSSGNAKGVIYDTSGGNANALKGTTNSVVVVDDNVDVWQDYTFASPVSLTAADYFLGIIADDLITGRGDTTGTPGTGTNQYNNNLYSDGPSDPFGTPSSSSYEKSIYATYTTAGSYSPSISPSTSPSVSPPNSYSPSVSSSISPSASPSVSVSKSPSVSPSSSISPSISPSSSPSRSVSISPSISPSASLSISTSVSPSISPSASISPSISTSLSPSRSLSTSPSVSLSASPSISISASPSVSPSTSISPSVSPSVSVSLSKSISPSISPSVSPVVEISLKTDYWKVTTGGSYSPSISVSVSPSKSLSASPSISPSVSPSTSISPSVSPSISVSVSPSISKSISPSVSPSTSISPSVSPSRSVSISPSISVSISPSVSPSTSISPSSSPSRSPSVSVSVSPSVSPSTSISPSASPSISVSLSGSVSPSISPSVSAGGSYSPSISLSASPSISISKSPSISPSTSPSTSISPSISPSRSISLSPSVSISISPSISPSRSASVSLSISISKSPSASPSLSISLSPSVSPSSSISPSVSPSESPSASISPSVSPSPSPGIPKKPKIKIHKHRIMQDIVRIRPVMRIQALIFKPKCDIMEATPKISSSQNRKILIKIK